jgi:hypothetical protein
MCMWDGITGRASNGVGEGSINGSSGMVVGHLYATKSSILNVELIP